MGHLITPFSGHDVAEVLKELSAAHRYLAEHGAEAVKLAAELKPGFGWGAETKRVKVCLPADEKPTCIPTDLTEHSLVEVMNQLATLERLVDALEWA